jgi:hypothetical protein
MNQYVVVYDRANTQIGFAPSRSIYCNGAVPPITGYFWSIGQWGQCVSANGTTAGCAYSRTVACLDSNGNAAAPPLCTAAEQRPILSAPCMSSDSGVCIFHISGGVARVSTYSFAALIFAFVLLIV